MKIYLAIGGGLTANMIATGELPLWIQRTKRRLFSYHYFHTADNRAQEDPLYCARVLKLDMFLDSGAFSAMMLGSPITCEQYAEFIHNTKDDIPWSVLSSLDEIGRGEEAARKSYENLKVLESLGCRVAPVFHVREPDHWLKKYLDEGYEYILIGGLVKENVDFARVRLDHLWEHYLTDAAGRARCKVHGFGLTVQSLMFRYPWYSVDSSSWIKYAAYGHTVFRIGNGYRTIQTSEKSSARRKLTGYHYDTLPAAMREKVDEWFAHHGFTAEQAKDYNYRSAINAAVFQELEDYGIEQFKIDQPLLFT